MSTQVCPRGKSVRLRREEETAACFPSCCSLVFLSALQLQSLCLLTAEVKWCNYFDLPPSRLTWCEVWRDGRANLAHIWKGPFNCKRAVASAPPPPSSSKRHGSLSGCIIMSVLTRRFSLGDCVTAGGMLNWVALFISCDIIRFVT